MGQGGTILATTTGGLPDRGHHTTHDHRLGADDLWHNTAVTLTLTATDNSGGSGMSGGSATTQYKIGTGSWQTGTTVVVPAPADHSGDGAQVVSYHSCDAAGNWETVKTVTVKIDTTSPTTDASGADDLWHNTAVTLTLTPTDNSGGSGMSGGSATTQYKIGTGSWTTGTTVVGAGTRRPFRRRCPGGQLSVMRRRRQLGERQDGDRQDRHHRADDHRQRRRCPLAQHRCDAHPDSPPTTAAARA